MALNERRLALEESQAEDAKKERERQMALQLAGLLMGGMSSGMNSLTGLGGMLGGLGGRGGGGLGGF